MEVLIVPMKTYILARLPWANIKLPTHITRKELKLSRIKLKWPSALIGQLPLSVSQLVRWFKIVVSKFISTLRAKTLRKNLISD